MPLTDTAIRNAKPREKQYKLSDGKGMYVLVKKAGRYFRLDDRFQAAPRQTEREVVWQEIEQGWIRSLNRDDNSMKSCYVFSPHPDRYFLTIA